jgi:hypothetical protein
MDGHRLRKMVAGERQEARRVAISVGRRHGRPRYITYLLCTLRDLENTSYYSSRPHTTSTQASLGIRSIKGGYRNLTHPGSYLRNGQPTLGRRRKSKQGMALILRPAISEVKPSVRVLSHLS